MTTIRISAGRLGKRMGGLLGSAGLVAGGLVGATVLAAAPAHAASCDTTWTGAAGDYSWGTAGNWTNGVPSASSMACLPDTSSLNPYQVLITGNHIYVGGIFIGSNATLEVQGGPFTGGADVQVGGYGVDNEGGTLTFNNPNGYGAFFGIGDGSGTLNNNGTLLLNDTYFNANVTNDQSGTVEATDTAPGEFSIVNNLANLGSLFVDNGAQLDPQDLTSIDANGQLTGGHYVISGTLAIGNPNLVQRVFSNSADLDLNGTGAVTDPYGNNALALLRTNNAGAVLALTNGGQQALSISGFTNSGIVLIAGAGSKLTAPGYVQSGGETSLESGGAVWGGVNLQGGFLSGGGTVHGGLRNAALVELNDAGSAKLSVVGPYTQTSAGTLETYVDNHWVGCAGHSQTASCLTVSGAVRLAGTLDVDVTASPTPPAGRHYTLTTTNKTEAGKFGHVVQVNGALPGNLGVVPTSYGPQVVLTVKTLG